MLLPPPLHAAIESIAQDVPPARLARAVGELMAGYHPEAGAVAQFAPDTPERQAAYAVVRLPATLAAAGACCRELASQAPGFAPASMLDLGAGPGTMVWAAEEIWGDSLAEVTMVERDPGFIQLGGALGAGGAAARWHRGDLTRIAAAPVRADLVTMGYVLGELAADARERVVQLAWQATAGALLLIEPGTPAGFAAILRARAALLAAGAHVVAPCSHGGGCPLAAAGEWCHFVQRFPRTARHRAAKGGTLGYEDEKFSWLAVVREPMAPRGGRVLEQPRANKAEVTLRLCAPDTPEQMRVAKRENPEQWKRARKMAWGDVWPG